mgnify:CR=1 FL=1
MAGISKAERARRAAVQVVTDRGVDVNLDLPPAIADVVDDAAAWTLAPAIRLQAVLGCLLCVRGKDEAELFDNAIAMADRLLKRMARPSADSSATPETPAAP